MAIQTNHGKWRCFLGLMLAMGLTAETSAQIPPERTTNWSVAGVTGGIPCYDRVLDMQALGAIPDGVTDNGLLFQRVLDTVAVETVLYFPPGDYRIRREIRIPLKGRVIVRGAGADQTRLLFETGALGNRGLLDVSRGNRMNNEADVLSGYTAGSTQLTVASLTGFAVGRTASIDQDNDPALMSSQTTPNWNISWAVRSIGQMFVVTAIDSATNTLTLDRPLRFSYDPDFTPRVRSFTTIEYVGFENFTVENLQDGDKFTFFFRAAANCWIKGVHSLKTVKFHVSTPYSRNLTIVDSYFDNAFNHGGGGYGYGVTLENHTTDCRVENNVFRRLRHAMMTKQGANGNVFGYNYAFEGIQTGSSQVPVDISVHGHFSYMNLFEGNIVQRIHSADFWGPSGPGTTFFRNRVEASNLQISDGSIDQNVVGNEVVTPGRQIVIAPSVINTFVHGNNVTGTVSWTPGSGTDNLAASYYLPSPPSFWNIEATWPTIGVPNALDSGTIPARTRYVNLGNAPIHEVCGEVVLSNRARARVPLQVRAVPTPFGDRLWLQWDQPPGHEVHFRLVAATGHTLQAGLWPPGSAGLSTAHLPPGVYWLEVITPSGRGYLRLLKRP